MNLFTNIQDYFSEDNTSDIKKPEPVIIDSDFSLPIDYLDKTDVKTIAEHVSSDLELMVNPNGDEKNMYQHLFQPSNPFGEQILHKWNEKKQTTYWNRIC